MAPEHLWWLISSHQDLPDIRRYRRRTAIVMVEREVDCQGRSTGPAQLRGSDHPVVPVGSHAGRKWKPREYRHRGERPPDQTEPGVSLADVVEQRCRDDVRVGVPLVNHRKSGFVAVTLVGIGLIEEQLGQGTTQPAIDSRSLGGIESARGRNIEEPLEQMSCRVWRQFGCQLL